MPDPNAILALIDALDSKDPKAFASLPLKGGDGLTDPQTFLHRALIGVPTHGIPIPTPDAFANASLAAEMCELWEMALHRDTYVEDFHAKAELPGIHRAVTALNKFGTAFRGPKGTSGSVTGKQLFRGELSSSQVGPVMSQFLLVDYIYGSLPITPKQLREVGTWGISKAKWFEIEQGYPQPGPTYAHSALYPNTLRALASTVHFDSPSSLFNQACYILKVICLGLAHYSHRVPGDRAASLLPDPNPTPNPNPKP